MRSSVVLPHPLGPTIMKNQPAGMSSVIGSSATKGPDFVGNVLLRSRSRIFTSAMAGATSLFNIVAVIAQHPRQRTWHALLCGLRLVRAEILQGRFHEGIVDDLIDA